MNDPLYNRLQETSWRRKLSPREEADLQSWLGSHPEHQADWTAESNLNEALRRLPNAPVPTNFTARVLDAVERESKPTHRHAHRWSWRRLLPKAAYAAIVFAIGALSYHHHQQVARRAEQARYIAAVSRVAILRDPEVLQDFDAIQKLGQTQAPDEELLALMR